MVLEMDWKIGRHSLQRGGLQRVRRDVLLRMISCAPVLMLWQCNKTVD